LFLKVGLGVYLIGQIYSMEGVGVECARGGDVERGGKYVVTNIRLCQIGVGGLQIQRRRVNHGVRE
jgi:hypothetical protein